VAFVNPENMANSTKCSKIAHFVACQLAGVDMVYVALIQENRLGAMDAFTTIPLPDLFSCHLPDFSGLPFSRHKSPCFAMLRHT